RDVDVRRDPQAGLADLVRVGPPAGARDDARAADGSAEQSGQLFEIGKSLTTSDAASAADDHPGVGERDLAALGRLPTRHVEGEAATGQCDGDVLAGGPGAG